MIVLLTVLSGLLILMLQMGLQDGLTLIVSESSAYGQFDHPAKVFPDHYPWDTTFGATKTTQALNIARSSVICSHTSKLLCPRCSGLLSVHNDVNRLLGTQH